MSFYRSIFELIDMRSFSTLWFWIALGSAWVTAIHYVLGIPYDMVARAARQNGQAAADLQALARIRVRRLLGVAHAGGAWLVGAGAMVLTVLALLGFRYGLEFAQAVFLLALPLSLVAALSVRTAEDIARRDLTGEALRRRLARHRHAVQAIAMASIFFTAMWGMYRNLDVGPLGG